MSAIRCAHPQSLRLILIECADALGVEKFVLDPCGIVMAAMTWFLVLWANARVLHYVTLERGMDLLLFTAFATMSALALTCHFKAMMSDPGEVPLRPPGAPPLRPIDRDRPQWIDGQLVTTCPRCDVYKPFRAHHCSTCGRCVRMMDHHCPWMNNCIGERNHKFFVLFCGYIFGLSALALMIVVRFLMQCPVRWSKCVLTSPWEPLALLLFFMEIFLFGLFTLIMACDQMCGIAYDTTTLERMRGGGTGPRPSVMANFRRVFGGELGVWWLLPARPSVASPDPLKRSLGSSTSAAAAVAGNEILEL